MNIFQNTDDFFGCLNTVVTKDSLLALFKLANQIRLRLGKKGYLLDCYLSLFFEQIHSNLTYDAVDEGTRMSGTLQSMLYCVLDGKKPEKSDPFFERIQEVYEQNADKLNFQERFTNLCLLMFYLTDEFMTCAANVYKKEVNHTIDIIRFQELYDQISHLAGESMMEELNQQLRMRFQIVPLALAFAQGTSDDLLLKLTSRDDETSKQMFQLLLDNLSETQ